MKPPQRVIVTAAMALTIGIIAAAFAFATSALQPATAAHASVPVLLDFSSGQCNQNVPVGQTCTGNIEYVVQTATDVTSFGFAFAIGGTAGSATIVQASTSNSCPSGMSGTWNVTATAISASCAGPSSSVTCANTCVVATVVIQCNNVAFDMGQFPPPTTQDTFNGGAVPTHGTPIVCVAAPTATATATATNTATATPITVARSATPTPTPTVTATSTSSPTPAPSNTPAALAPGATSAGGGVGGRGIAPPNTGSGSTTRAGTSATLLVAGALLLIAVSGLLAFAALRRR